MYVVFEYQMGIRSLFLRSDENEARGNWRGRVDYIMVTISVFMGMNDLWMGPHLSFSHVGTGIIHLCFTWPGCMFSYVVG